MSFNNFSLAKVAYHFVLVSKNNILIDIISKMTACQTVADNRVFTTCVTTSDYHITEFNLTVKTFVMRFLFQINALSIKETWNSHAHKISSTTIFNIDGNKQLF